MQWVLLAYLPLIAGIWHQLRTAQAAAIEALQEQLANIPGAEAIDLTGLQAVATKLDDLTPDVEPSPEPPADPAA